MQVSRKMMFDIIKKIYANILRINKFSIANELLLKKNMNHCLIINVKLSFIIKIN